MAFEAFRGGHQLQHSLFRQRKRAFGRNQQFGQIIAVFASPGHKHLSVHFRRSLLQPRAREHIFWLFRTSARAVRRNSSYISTQSGDRHGTRIRRIEKAPCRHCRREVCRYNTGFDNGIHFFFIDFENSVQTVRQDNHSLGTFGDGPPLRLVPNHG